MSVSVRKATSIMGLMESRAERDARRVRMRCIMRAFSSKYEGRKSYITTLGGALMVAEGQKIEEKNEKTKERKRESKRKGNMADTHIGL